MRVPISVLLAALAAAAALPATAQARPANPCKEPEAADLLCPNLTIAPPYDIHLDETGAGRKLLRAASDVRSRGRGPIELHGQRSGWRKMRTFQRIYRVGGGHLDVRGGATLRFTGVGAYFGGFYWKVHQLARFELVRVGPDGNLGRVLRVSPKLNYCLRDLERTWDGPRSPVRRQYPACDQDPYRDRVTLGTSVGWSDIYPAPYDKQWIQVGGLRGCFAYRMIVDPQDLLYESDETDNASQRLVRLPYRGGSGC